MLAAFGLREIHRVNGSGSKIKDFSRISCLSLKHWIIDGE